MSKRWLTQHSLGPVGPGRLLQQLVKDYEAETGIKVTSFRSRGVPSATLFFTEMAAGGTAWDMVVGDSQWLGQGATQGHYVDMTDFLVGEGIQTVTPPP
jgi:multiple sugar transport system substrate-binding protein